MAHAEGELEGQLAELGNRLASPPSNLDELLALLDQAESFLSRVEQAPSESMSTALYPVMKALVAKELLRHSEMDVKISLASCFSEITRITAPDAPYDDDLMKDIFQMIVDAFENLDDLSSRSYSKRVSILETVANVRSCVVMLDLECDDLILEMFQHFLKTIRTSHTRNVFSSMETVMALVLEESEDISSELLSCLLASVKKDNMDLLPITRRLGEKVIGNCALKLRPYLIELVQSMGASLNDYCNIIASICQENSDKLELNELNASGECLADVSKLSEMTISDELPQESGKLESEVGCPEEIGTVADKSSISVVSNGTIPKGYGGFVVGTSSPKQKPECYRCSGQSKSAIAAAIAEPDDVDSSTVVKPDSMADHSTKKRWGQISNSSIQLTDTIGHSQIDGDKAALAVPSRRSGRNKKADGLQADGPSSKKAEASLCLEPEQTAKLEPSVGLDSENVCIASPTPSENTLDATRPRKRRPSQSNVTVQKHGVDAVANLAASTSVQKGASDNDQTEEETLPSEDIESKKEDEFISDSVGKPLSLSVKRILEQNADDGETPSADVSLKEVDETIYSEAKNLSQTSKNRLTRTITVRESSERQKCKIKQQKEKILVKDLAGEQSLKEMVSSPKSLKALNKDQYHLDEGNRTNSRNLRSRRTEEVSKAQHREKELDETLVGSKIKVWWPDDKMFYGGAVDSFDPVSKKHKVLYFDGDVEILLLKDECWKFLEDDSKTDGGQAKEIPSPDTPPEMPPKKIAKRSSDATVKQWKNETPLKSGGRAVNKSRAYGTRSVGKKGGNDVMKTKARPKGGASKLVSITIEEMFEGFRTKAKDGKKYKDTTETISLCIGKPDDHYKDIVVALGSAFGDNTPKPVSKFKGETAESSSKSKEDTPKAASKSKDVAVNTGNKPKAVLPVTTRKSNDSTREAGREPKDTCARKTGGGSDTDASYAEGKPKTQETDDCAVNLQFDPENSHENAGWKRRRMAESCIQVD